MSRLLRADVYVPIALKHHDPCFRRRAYINLSKMRATERLRGQAG